MKTLKRILMASFMLVIVLVTAGSQNMDSTRDSALDHYEAALDLAAQAKARYLEAAEAFDEAADFADRVVELNDAGDLAQAVQSALMADAKRADAEGLLEEARSLDDQAMAERELVVEQVRLFAEQARENASQARSAAEELSLLEGLPRVPSEEPEAEPAEEPVAEEVAEEPAAEEPAVEQPAEEPVEEMVEEVAEEPELLESWVLVGAEIVEMGESEEVSGVFGDELVKVDVYEGQEAKVLVPVLGVELKVGYETTGKGIEVSLLDHGVFQGSFDPESQTAVLSGNLGEDMAFDVNFARTEPPETLESKPLESWTATGSELRVNGRVVEISENIATQPVRVDVYPGQEAFVVFPGLGLKLQVGYELDEERVVVNLMDKAVFEASYNPESQTGMLAAIVPGSELRFRFERAES